MNLPTIILAVLIGAATLGIIARMIYNKKQGKSSCACGGCSGCAMKEQCHPTCQNETKDR